MMMFASRFLVAIAVLAVSSHFSLAGCPCEQGQMAPRPARAQLPIGPSRLTTAPPNGTIGRTYYLPSRDIPAEKHPRVAMLDVIAPNATSVRLVNVYVHREEDDVDGFESEYLNGLWRFETLPLIPGNPHIYKVIFRFSDEPLARESVRYVRLVPGRILELTY